MPTESAAAPLPAATKASVLKELVNLAAQSWQVYDTDVLHDAIKHRGTSVADHPFVDLYGKPGGYQDDLKVYGREGEPCRRCRAPVMKARFANKPLYFCEECQV